MFGTAWTLVKESVNSFISDEALTRGAAIAFYTVTSIGPVLFIVVAIAGLAFGEDAARGAIAEQLGGLMGRQSADLLQTAIQSAATKTTGFLATMIGLITLIITASGVFTEMQSTLNTSGRPSHVAPRSPASFAPVPRAWDWWAPLASSCWSPWSSAPFSRL